MTIESHNPLDRVFQALAHPTRRKMLAQLMSEPGTSAGTLAARFDAAQPTLSRHLLQLERAGLVTRQVKGRSHLFCANAEALSLADAWLTDHRAFWTGSLQRLGRFLDEDEL
ncbi:helix-turn-helix transcriptional regulator [Yoonia sp. I 8.24]|uniref:ArsR/SmtB family transcription factor n=1 Tax=Yoonia sp. I 8.24 TaxID=1537229 RepID=UPI001FA38BB9|nr:helix-turn-helix transcriptional regulator [Yoonia sp. I 8.24]MCG3268617.1 helix-turn-helix transcriptional regulator [Yoonia sp. I 8.24]